MKYSLKLAENRLYKKTKIMPIRTVIIYVIKHWTIKNEERKRSILFSWEPFFISSKWSDLDTIKNRVKDKKNEKNAKLWYENWKIYNVIWKVKNIKIEVRTQNLSSMLFKRDFAKR